MSWLLYLRNPLGRLLSSTFAVGLLALLWVTVGHGIVNQVVNDTARQGGGGPESNRLVNENKLVPVVDALRKKVGSDAQLLSVTMRPTSVEFVVRDGDEAKGYRSEDASTNLESVGVNLYGPGRVSENAFPIRKLDPAAPQKIASAISRKENGDFHLTIATLERQANGRLLWDVKGTIDGRGVAYVAEQNGRRLETFNPLSPRQSSVPREVTNIQHCIKAAANDPAKLQACAQGLGG